MLAELVDARLARRRRHLRRLRQLRTGGNLAGHGLDRDHAAFARGHDNSAARNNGSRRVATQLLPPDELAIRSFHAHEFVTATVDQHRVREAVATQRKRLVCRFIADESPPEHSSALGVEAIDSAFDQDKNGLDVGGRWRSCQP